MIRNCGSGLSVGTGAGDTIRHRKSVVSRPTLALQLFFRKASESMGNHDSEIVDAGSVESWLRKFGQ